MTQLWIRQGNSLLNSSWQIKAEQDVFVKKHSEHVSARHKHYEKLMAEKEKQADQIEGLLFSHSHHRAMHEAFYQFSKDWSAFQQEFQAIGGIE